MATEAQLIAALQWALEEGATTSNYLGALEFRDGGCGCCSDKLPLPAEHVEAMLAAFPGTVPAPGSLASRMCKYDDGDCHADDPCEGCPNFPGPTNPPQSEK